MLYLSTNIGQIFTLLISNALFILTLSLCTLGAHDYEASKRAHRLLQCNSQKALFTPQELRRNPQQWDAHRCRFSGSGLLGLLSSYNMNRHEVETSLERISEKGKGQYISKSILCESSVMQWDAHRCRFSGSLGISQFL